MWNCTVVKRPSSTNLPNRIIRRLQRLLNEVKKVETIACIETLKRIRECRRNIRRVFEHVDVLVLTTMREPAPLISETVN